MNNTSYSRNISLSSLFSTIRASFFLIRIQARAGTFFRFVFYLYSYFPFCTFNKLFRICEIYFLAWHAFWQSTVHWFESRISYAFLRLASHFCLSGFFFKKVKKTSLTSYDRPLSTALHQTVILLSPKESRVRSSSIALSVMWKVNHKTSVLNPEKKERKQTLDNSMIWFNHGEFDYDVQNKNCKRPEY